MLKNVNSKENKTKIRSPHRKHPKILFVADSVGKITDRNMIQRCQNGRLSTALVDDTTNSSVASKIEKAVVANLDNPGNEHYKYLVISAPTNDISNANGTSKKSEELAIKSCQTLIRTAENALKNNKFLKTVVIMEHHTRFDDINKAHLARFANNHLNHLVTFSSMKEKILIGRHSLEGFGIGITHKKRYIDTRTGLYDGIHLWGPSGQSDYTSSVIKILQLSLPELSKPQNFANEWTVVKSKNRQTDRQKLYQGNF